MLDLLLYHDCYAPLAAAIAVVLNLKPASMLALRTAQLESLAESARLSFKARLHSHLARFFPEHCSKLGAERIDLAIDFAIRRAGLYGIESEHGICVYADIMFAFGHLFEEAPEHAWAARVLRDPNIFDPAIRVERLYEEAMNFLRQREATRSTPGR